MAVFFSWFGVCGVAALARACSELSSMKIHTATYKFSQLSEIFV